MDIQYKNKLSICIPTYNRPELVSKTVRHISAFECKAIEIVITDNSANDLTKNEIVKIPDARIRYIKNECNVGRNGNTVRALREAENKFALILSDDDILNLNSIPRILDVINQYPELGAVVGSVKNYDGTDLVKYRDQYYKKGKDSCMNIYHTGHLVPVVFNKSYLDLEFLSLDKDIKYMQNLIMVYLCVCSDIMTLKNVFGTLSQEYFETHTVEEIKMKYDLKSLGENENLFYFPKSRKMEFEKYASVILKNIDNHRDKKLIVLKFFKELLKQCTVYYQHSLNDPKENMIYHFKNTHVNYKKEIHDCYMKEMAFLSAQCPEIGFRMPLRRACRMWNLSMTSEEKQGTISGSFAKLIYKIMAWVQQKNVVLFYKINHRHDRRYFIS